MVRARGARGIGGCSERRVQSEVSFPWGGKDFPAADPPATAMSNGVKSLQGRGGLFPAPRADLVLGVRGVKLNKSIDYATNARNRIGR